MQTITNINQSTVTRSLDTYRHTTTAAGPYTVSMEISEVPASSIAIDIQQNSVSKGTSTAPSATQSHVKLEIKLNCAANDVIDIIVTSSAGTDNQLNTLKGILNIRQGNV